jgi:hypothetical protein
VVFQKDIVVCAQGRVDMCEALQSTSQFNCFPFVHVCNLMFPNSKSCCFLVVGKEASFLLS